MSTNREIDAVTGVETTGHEWDGIKELNKPLPRWWIWTFYATILWSIGYWIVYPAWPTLHGYTAGIWGYSQRAAVTAEVKAGKNTDIQKTNRELLEKTPLADVKKNAELLRFAIAGGKAAFAENCAPCHGRGAQGSTGYPNLADDDWLWGGTIEDIHKTLLVGIRAGNKQTRESAMPKFGIEKLLQPAQIELMADYVMSLSNLGPAPAADKGAPALFKAQCAQCHGEDGKGKMDQGAPNLTDPIWLYGKSRDQVVESIRTGRGGVMPAWAGRLDPITVKALAVYVHSLGGGK